MYIIGDKTTTGVKMPKISCGYTTPKIPKRTFDTINRTENNNNN